MPVGKIGRPNRASTASKKRKTKPPSRNKQSVTPLIEEAIPDVEEGILDVQEVPGNVPDSVGEDIDIDFQNSTGPVPEPEEDDDLDGVDSVAASAKKLKTIPVPEVDNVTIPECNIFMNTFLLKEFFEKLARCPECGATLSLKHKMAKRKGLAHFSTCTSDICVIFVIGLMS